MTTLRAKLAIMGAVICLAGGLQARGDSVIVKATFNSSQPNTVGTALTSNYNDHNYPNATTVSTVAGIYNFTLQDITGSEASSPLKLSEVKTALGLTTPSSVFQAVCIDFTHNVWYGQSDLTWEVKNRNRSQFPRYYSRL